MTEADWLTCTDPDRMLRFLPGRAAERKLRLFACACCRRIDPGLTDERCRRALGVVERCADGLAGRPELEAALADAAAVEATSAGLARVAARAVVAAWSTPEHARSAAAHASAGPAREMQRQADLLRDVVGNPFRPVPVRLSWLRWGDGRVERIARGIYDHCLFGDLPLLADALEEAGCADAAVLGHGRSGDEHARGCWVLDGLLGTPVVADAVDESLPAWTVRRAVEQEGRCVRQTSCPGHFAIVRLTAEPGPGPSPVVFLNATEDDPRVQAWVPAVEEGVRQFVAKRAAHGQRVVGARIVLTGLTHHPIDSRASSFERATLDALTQAFAGAGAPIPPD